MAFNSVNPQMGLSMGLKGLAIIILGGMGNVKGAMAGGLTSWVWPKPCCCLWGFRIS